MDPGFASAHPEAAVLLGDLVFSPGGPREPDPEASGAPGDRRYGIEYEEFYDRNASLCLQEVDHRPGLEVMFAWVAARDDVYPPDHSRAGQPLVPPDYACPGGREMSSVLTGAACGILSSAHSATKPLVGSRDVLWGFHPLAFDPATVQGALEWIFRYEWGLGAP